MSVRDFGKASLPLLFPPGDLDNDKEVAADGAVDDMVSIDFLNADTDDE